MTRDTEQEVKPCKFVGGACVNCDATERDGCLGWVCSPKRPWVGLTDEEIEAVVEQVANGKLVGTVQEFRIRFSRAIEAKLKERNT